MKTTLPEQKQAEKLLQRNKIQLHDIKSFSFMERYHQAPRKDSRVSKDKYGAGLLDPISTSDVCHPLSGVKRNTI